MSCGVGESTTWREGMPTLAAFVCQLAWFGAVACMSCSHRFFWIAAAPKRSLECSASCASDAPFFPLTPQAIST